MAGINLLGEQVNTAGLRDLNKRLMRIGLGAVGLAIFGWVVVVELNFFWKGKSQDIERRLSELSTAILAYEDLESEEAAYQSRLDLVGQVMDGQDAGLETVAEFFFRTADAVGGRVVEMAYDGEGWKMEVELADLADVQEYTEKVNGWHQEGCEIDLWGPMGKNCEKSVGRKGGSTND
jgi:hypothetical protein